MFFRVHARAPWERGRDGCSKVGVGVGEGRAQRCRRALRDATAEARREAWRAAQEAAAATGEEALGSSAFTCAALFMRGSPVDVALLMPRAQPAFRLMLRCPRPMCSRFSEGVCTAQVSYATSAPADVSVRACFSGGVALLIL